MSRNVSASSVKEQHHDEVNHHHGDKHHEGPPPAPSAKTRAAAAKPATLGAIGEKKSFFHKMFHHEGKEKLALEVPARTHGFVASGRTSPRYPKSHQPNQADINSPPLTPGTPPPQLSDSEHSRPPSRAASLRRQNSGHRDPHAQPPVDARADTPPPALQRGSSQRSTSHGSSGPAAHTEGDSARPIAALSGQQAAAAKKDEVVGSGGNKFTLKDLIGLGDGSGKLSRKPSAAGSAKGSDRGSTKGSDRDYGDNNSTASLLKKYGICDKAAIGKGATAVVRLAHKWDRREEKLYAVKVRNEHLSLTLPADFRPGISKAPQERNGERLRQKANL